MQEREREGERDGDAERGKGEGEREQREVTEACGVKQRQGEHREDGRRCNNEPTEEHKKSFRDN